MTRKTTNQKVNRTVLAVIVVILLAVGGGALFSALRGGGGNGAEAASAASQGSFLEDIKKRGVLRVGVALSPPHTVQLPDGTYGGPNILPLQNLAKALDVRLETVPAEWKNIVAGLQAGRYDFAANLDRTLERSTAIQFTEKVWDYPAVFVVKADSPYVTTDDLLKSGKQIGTAQGTAHEASFVRQYPTAATLPTDSFTNLVQALKADRIVASLTDLPTAVSQAQEDSSLKIIVPTPDIYRGLVAYGVPANADSRSLQTVNIAIERALNEGVLQAEYAKVGYLDETQLAGAGLLKK
ncbi:substrate-binding periplasmic protein [Paenarthrobacter sp. NPDC090522]|uniref:substrate-binding periplasmic protein n=1 Tax=Paenarthrobacter sp. NPDC090522 TaxID=3364383 RepID=UPI00380CFAB6